MPKLPQIKPNLLLKFFIKQGFVITRQIGSHTRLVHTDGRKITIAIHNKPIAPGTLQSILKQANLERDIFLKLFKS
ncbi:MAG: type II toxin-antitoxin system HicA family toxin [Candidatus Daviesbacteria bacterium]|nr:type II toxin-antitoxin system HicA family toxin [Candidatus Daviesbacteria bacterium]